MPVVIPNTNANYQTSVSGIQDGDALNQTNINLAAATLVNRTDYLNSAIFSTGVKRIPTVSNSGAMAALPATEGDLCLIVYLGLYRYTTTNYSAIQNLIVPGTTGSLGTWIHTEYNNFTNRVIDYGTATVGGATITTAGGWYDASPRQAVPISASVGDVLQVTAFVSYTTTGGCFFNFALQTNFGGAPVRTALTSVNGPNTTAGFTALGTLSVNAITGDFAVQVFMTTVGTVTVSSVTYSYLLIRPAGY